VFDGQELRLIPPDDKINETKDDVYKSGAGGSRSNVK